MIKVVIQTTENELEEQRGGFLGMLFGTLVSSLLGNMLAGTGVIRTGDRVSGAGNKIFASKLGFYLCLIIWLILKYK